MAAFYPDQMGQQGFQQQQQQQPFMAQQMYQQQAMPYATPQYPAQQYAGYGGEGQQYAGYSSQAEGASAEGQGPKLTQRQLDKRDRLERVRAAQAKQKKQDKENFLRLMGGALVGLGVLLGLTMIGPSWGVKEFTGLGIGMVGMKTSLFKIEIDISCDKSFVLERALCRKVKPFEGVHDLQKSQGNACVMNPSACDVMSRTYHASFPLFALLSLAVLSNLGAAFCLFSYSKAVADTSLRAWCTTFVNASPLLASGGIVAWVVLMPDLGEIPTSWAALVGQLAPGLSYSETRDFQFGWTFFAACLIDFFMIVTAFCYMCLFKPSEQEEEEATAQAAADRAFCDALEEERALGFTKATEFAPGYGATDADA